jgi:putative oxidoreductase
MNILSQEKAFTLLRWSLGFTFFWFGILKLFNSSPVFLIIKNAVPESVGNSAIFYLMLGIIEIVIGLGFLANRYVRPIIILMILHLFGATLSVLFTQGFQPYFPVLSLPGEFVVKNLVLMAAGLVLFTQKIEKKE